MVAYIFVLIDIAYAVFSFGSCPQVVFKDHSASAINLCRDIQNNSSIFNEDLYLGRWYEIVRSKDAKFETGICNRADIRKNDKNEMEITFTEQFENNERNISGFFFCRPEDPGKCSVTFSKFLPSADWEIVSTDYSNFFVGFSCFSLGIAHRKIGWVFSRNKSLAYQDHIEMLVELGIPMNNLIIVEQINCINKL